MSTYASVSGARATSARLSVPEVGIWFLDAKLDAPASLSGAVDVVIGSVTLKGVVASALSGVFGENAVVRVIGGGGGWSKTLAAKHYHNDAGVKLSVVAGDAAREAGEVIDLLDGVERRLDVDFVRQAAPASRVLAQALRGVPWWVGYDGRTVAGARSQSDPRADAELLNYTPSSRVAVLGADDPGAVVVGTVLRARLAKPLEVRAFEVNVASDEVRISAWVKEAA